MIAAYLRVSTAMQDAENQRFEILKFCDEKRIQVDEWIIETVSGTRRFQDRKIGEVLDRAKKGDVILATEVSRFGRSLLDVMTIFHIAVKKEIIVMTCRERFVLSPGLHSTIYCTVLSLASEIERSMISQRTKEALARKKALGIPLGRPRGSKSKSKLDGKEEMIRELLAKDVGYASIAKIIGNVHDGTVAAFAKTRKLLPTHPNTKEGEKCPKQK